jgi:glucose/arabinose dehydrogenase
MGASSLRSWRWLLLALPLLGLAAGLAVERGAAAPQLNETSLAAPAAGALYLPYVGKPGTPQIDLVPFVVGFENKTITEITHAGDERLFVANREGKVWVVYPDGAIPETPFLDVTDKVQHEINFEQGFLGLAFHPDYPATPYFYFAYTSPSNIEIARGAVSSTNPDVADPKSIVGMITIHKPQGGGGPSPVHNGGDLAFGPDGYLYIPLGDGGPDPYDVSYLPGDPNNHSQRRDTLLGSILRVDPDPERGLDPDCGGNYYSIPGDNPWLGDGGCDEIWAKGLRNPWRISIDQLTGDFYIADVGEWLREEVNYRPAAAGGGANFGWHCWEGSVDYSTVWEEVADNCDYDLDFVFPVHEYDRSQGECSIIGGKVYRGSLYPWFYGVYFFGDWCSGRLWTMSRVGGEWQVNPAGQHMIRYTTFGEDVYGELYAGSYLSGILYKVVVH